MLISKYTDDWRLIAELTASWPYTQEEVYKELEQQEYHGNDLRTYCHDIKSPILKEIFDSVVKHIPLLLAEMSDQPVFQEKWSFDYKGQILNNVTTDCFFVCDKPGYNTDIHIDCRTQVCTGMLFFNKVNDTDQITKFYTTHNKDNEICMSSEYRKGWYAANTHDCWHLGVNNTNRNRYALLFINNLKLK